MVVPLAVGNALRLFLQPPAGALYWRVLRKGADTFTGESDPDAVRVYQGTQSVVLDAGNQQLGQAVYPLLNGNTYYYRAYYWDGSAWISSSTVGAAPAAAYADASTDVLTVVRDRLDCGLQTEVAAGVLFPDSGGIPVLIAPPMWEDARWPMVTVHLQSEAPSARGLGEMVEPDELDETGTEWNGTEGWLAKVQLTIVGWTQNPDERIALRKSLRRLIVANLSVFDAAGMVQIEFQQQDMDPLTEYPAPVYQVMCTLTCLAPVRVITARDAAIADVTTTIVEG